MRKFVSISGITILLFFNSCKKDIVSPVVVTKDVNEISYTTAISGGEVTNDGGAPVISKGICWSTSVSPTTSDKITTESGGLGTFSSNITQLNPNTTYYVRAYATNKAGTGYGNEVSFITKEVKVPYLTTKEISAITVTSATSGGTITDDNGSEVIARGICWNTSTNPLVTNKTTSDGSGKGTFESGMTDLEGGTTYYVRAYATNSAGTSYGNEISFTTNPPLSPAISTLNFSSLTTNSFRSGGTITSTGGAAITACGLCWDISPNPTTSHNKTTESYVPGNFTSDISGLIPNTTYHVRAYATNSAGTSYGNELTVFTYAVMDIEGNGYHSVILGTQTWMVENLTTTKYNNGDQIGTTSPATKDITTESNPKYQWAYNGDEANAAIYGRLYTWFAVSDSRNLCPTGWHVSTDLDWGNLEVWLINNGYKYDGSTGYEVYNKLGKSLAATTLWAQSDIVGSVGNTDYPTYRNKTGFSALPAGVRSKNGWFATLGTGTVWWTSTGDAYLPEFAWARVMDNTHDYNMKNGYLKVDLANSVRCIKD